jgi:putative ABC transport system ATP-binding protein
MENAANIIKEKELTTLMVTHNMREAVNYGNRLLMMKEGRVEIDVNGEEKMKLSANHLFDWLN